MHALWSVSYTHLIGGVALISVGGAVMISALGLLFLLLTMLSDTVYYLSLIHI